MRLRTLSHRQSGSAYVIALMALIVLTVLGLALAL
jgi:Tfp pilus assembly protein PilX